MKTAEIDFELKAMNLQPGDVLVVELPPDVSEEAGAKLQRSIVRKAPKGTPVFVVPHGVRVGQTREAK